MSYVKPNKGKDDGLFNLLCNEGVPRTCTLIFWWIKIHDLKPYSFWMYVFEQYLLTLLYMYLYCIYTFCRQTARKTEYCCRGYICPCYPIFQSAMSAAPTDGLMRGMHVLSYFLQSAHSRRFDRRQLWTKNTEEASKLLRHTRTCTRRETEIYSEGQNNIRDTSWCT